MVITPALRKSSSTGSRHRRWSNAGVVDFSIFPHLDREAVPENSMADAAKWTAGVPVPAYAPPDYPDPARTVEPTSRISTHKGQCMHLVTSLEPS